MENKLFMPANIQTDKYIIPGLTNQDLVKIGIITAFGIAIGFIIYLFTTSIIIAVILVLFFMLIGYGLMVREANGINMYMYLGFIFVFIKEQKMFNYTYKEVFYINEEN